MASTSDRKHWEEKAAFMRDVGAVHAEWAPDGEGGQLLMRLTLAPLAPAPYRAGPPAEPKTPGPAARLAKMHETMFAATSMRPKLPQAHEPAAVRHAPSVKKAAKHGSAKNQKRGS